MIAAVERNQAEIGLYVTAVVPDTLYTIMYSTNSLSPDSWLPHSHCEAHSLEMTWFGPIDPAWKQAWFRVVWQ